MKETGLNLEQRKELMLNMLIKLMDFCEKNQLKVYLAGGTLLGAVRHNGFIPWDDDIDVMMPLEDCHKLIDLIKNEKIDDHIFISSRKYNHGHIWPFYKLIDQHTVLIEPITIQKIQKSQKEFYGVYIDIFPMYGLPDEDTERLNFQKTLCSYYRKFQKATRRMNKRPQDSQLLYIIRSILYFIYCIPNRILGSNYYLSKIEEMIGRYSLGETKYFGWATGLTTGSKDHIRTASLNDTIKLNFEGVECEVFSNYGQILKNQYGDYMKLPPEGQRHIHPSNVFWRGEKR